LHGSGAERLEGMNLQNMALDTGVGSRGGHSLEAGQFQEDTRGIPSNLHFSLAKEFANGNSHRFCNLRVKQS